MPAELPPVPVPDAEDRAQALFRAILGSLPLPGTAAMVETFNLFFSPEIERRTRAWLVELRSAVKELQGRLDAASFENLRHDPAFYSVVAQATQIARQTHHKEKLTMLRNAVVNAALPGAPDEDVQSIFLTMIGDFTPTHIAVLQRANDLLEEHLAVTHVRGKDSDAVIEAMLEGERDEWNGQGLLLRLVADTLLRERLIKPQFLRPIETEAGTWEIRSEPEKETFTTPLGKRFLAFIEDTHGS